MLKYSVDRHSFPQDTEHAEYAAEALKAAASLWNERKIGVQFKEVANHEPATFRLVYDHQQLQDDLLANAFLPNEVQTGKPRLTVYPLAFCKERDYYNYLTNVFCHELGHVLGLRHEFKESFDPSVRWGKENGSSVMNYFVHPSEFSIQRTDYKDLRRFYASKGTQYKGFSIVDVDPAYFVPPSE